MGIQTLKNNRLPLEWRRGRWWLPWLHWWGPWGCHPRPWVSCFPHGGEAPKVCAFLQLWCTDTEEGTHPHYKCHFTPSHQLSSASKSKQEVAPYVRPAYCGSMSDCWLCKMAKPTYFQYVRTSSEVYFTSVSWYSVKTKIQISFWGSCTFWTFDFTTRSLRKTRSVWGSRLDLN